MFKLMLDILQTFFLYAWIPHRKNRIAFLYKKLRVGVKNRWTVLHLNFVLQVESNSLERENITKFLGIFECSLHSFPSVEDTCQNF
jgi:hypothetical protein